MKITYIAKIEASIPGMDVKYTKTIESLTPGELLDAISFTNGTSVGVPTLQGLLYHLYEKHAAYAGRNYLITIKVE